MNEQETTKQAMTIEEALKPKAPSKPMEGKKAVVVLSGGMDSAVALYWAIAQGYECETITVFYGQKHKKEIVAASQVAATRRAPNIMVDASGLQEVLKGSALTGKGKVPHGHYAEDTMKETVVPNRNMILLSIATARAVQTKAHAVVYGPHAGDHAIYPDCRKQFVDAMAESLALCDYEPIGLLTPFLDMTKADIVTLGVELGVPFDITWTCYEGGRIHCGKCGTCVERREAFETAGVPDPVEFQDRNAWAQIIHAAEMTKQLQAKRNQI
jgi:7-cyano-7-deazaguanine synthase